MADVIERTRTFHGVRKTYQVYTREEADAAGIAYVPWRTMPAAGAFCLTDDDMVCEVVALKVYYRPNGKINRWILILPFKEQFYSKSAKCLFWEWEKRPQIKRNWREVEARRTRTREVIRMYLLMRLTRRAVDWDYLVSCWRPDQRRPVATLKRLFRMEEVQHIMRQEMKKILEESGLTPQFAIEKIKESITGAQEKGDHATCGRLAIRVAEWLGVDKDFREIPEGDEEALALKAAEERLLRAPIVDEKDNVPRQNVFERAADEFEDHESEASAS